MQITREVLATCNYKRRTVAKVMEITDSMLWDGETSVAIADDVNFLFFKDYALYCESVGNC